ncbi:GPI ethanolamine phosphate transferase 3 [Bradysia coprophila]|uniref:GPI ethanolamine phosphate transferase 3 n=1 Tax=Bradysia coprophila TaxID=38358 RepID=UPI00187D6F2E|nr:GPI ethanolamine phosphate transferase 3 [Bradysia coprophila]
MHGDWGNVCRYFFVLLWLVLTLSAGVHIFSKGFLLSRVTNTYYTNCTALERCADEENDKCLSKSKLDGMFNDLNKSTEFCLPKKSKVILLVIDALKYDFGLYDKDNKDPLPHENRLPIMHDLLEKDPNHARLLRFKADPPTTTMQRLKGLTTGSLPTFIDIGSNFATPEINEDNIIDQMVRQNLSIVFMGDSTWVELFPDRFRRQYPFPSFNIYDLDTVDNGIRKILPNELKRNDWDVMIAHFLGVDHCGHKYGPLHSEMSRKLTEMNEEIEKVIEQMDDDTTLYVIGDHGMTVTGDHGGDSADEVNALLFAYSKQRKFFDDPEFSSQEMKQIDLVPTLAITLGVPIPFSNLGTINYNIIPDVPTEHFNQRQQFLMHSWHNAFQIRRYLANITDNAKALFEQDILEQHYTKFIVLSYRAISLYSPAAQDNYHKDLHAYLADVHRICSDIWVKFDPGQMMQGLLFVAFETIFISLLIGNLKVYQLQKVFSRKILFFAYISDLFIATVVVQYTWQVFGFSSTEHAAIVLVSIYNIGFLAVLVMANWPQIAKSLSEIRFTNPFARLLLVASVSVFFSNSYIVQEQQVLCYMLAGVLLAFLYSIWKTGGLFDLRTKWKLNTIFGAPFTRLALLTTILIVVLRNSHVYFRCREEQGNCTNFETVSNYYESDRRPSTASNSDASIYHPTLALAIFIILTRLHLKSCGNLRGHSFHVFFAQSGAYLGGTAVGSYFILSQTSTHGVNQWHIDALAWIVYSLSAVQILLLLISPLLVDIDDSGLSLLPANGITHIFHKIRNELNANGFANVRDDYVYKIPLIHGLTTIHSSVLISVGSCVALTVALLLGPNAAGGLFLSLYTAAGIAILNAVLRYQTERRLDKCLQPIALTTVAWSLLAQYAFYATSHQPTLSQIDWHAAFVGRQASIQHDHTNSISVVMVLLNTFGGPILIYLLYPLTMVTGPTLFAKYRSLVPQPPKTDGKSKNPQEMLSDKSKKVVQPMHDFDVNRGCIVLIENEYIFIGTLFQTGVSLVVILGLRIFCSMLACTIHCRHLMVWKIFAPKFIYEGITSYLGFAAIIVGFLIAAKVHTATVSFIKKIAK